LYVDTHAGAGCYDLRQEWAQKHREYEGGISRLWHCNDLPEALQGFIRVIEALNSDGKLRYYPGSPWLAQALLRSDDRLRLYELHPAEFQSLLQLFSKNRQISVEQSNGFAALKALLPPPQRRALVLLDPPYEVKEDYHVLVSALQDAYKRMPTGVYQVWYPVVMPAQTDKMLKKIKSIGFEKILRLELCVDTRAKEGMARSGVLVLNPPWILAQQMAQILPYLAQHLALGGAGDFSLESLP
jgi:23S rRNA (adenine2030-N6)-methyltransferase